MESICSGSTEATRVVIDNSLVSTLAYYLAMAPHNASSNPQPEGQLGFLGSVSCQQDLFRKDTHLAVGLLVLSLPHVTKPASATHSTAKCCGNFAPAPKNSAY